MRNIKNNYNQLEMEIAPITYFIKPQLTENY